LIQSTLIVVLVKQVGSKAGKKLLVARVGIFGCSQRKALLIYLIERKSVEVGSCVWRILGCLLMDWLRLEQVLTSEG
jgi:hypothetical protein